MEFISDPPISDKIEKMKQRVRWQDSAIVSRGIDQTRVVFDSHVSDEPNFSFLVIGDSGSGPHRGHNAQRKVAELMLNHREKSRFVLHTGDVIYLVGSSEYYLDNFIQPYREFLVGGEEPENIYYERMIFNQPFLPVLGNHDYYDLPLIFGLMGQTLRPLRRILSGAIDLEIGWHGSGQGRAYTKAFLDYLQRFSSSTVLAEYLDSHYTASTNTGRCLLYQPGKFTRLPNRYYTFRTGGIDFFALDSNTFNAPLPIPKTSEGKATRRLLRDRRKELEQIEKRILETSAKLHENIPEEAEKLDDFRTLLEQIEETKLDIEKQLQATQINGVDLEQLEWLKERLIESWHTKDVRGRVLYFHHPPYVTEATKWDQAQTLAVRRHLRTVLDEVAKEVGTLAEGRPLVDLVINGHAHCLEHLYTGDTGHGDSHIHWIVCGGSGYSLRRQRSEGSRLMEVFNDSNGGKLREVAESKLFVGRSGYGRKKRRPYSCVKINVKSGSPLQFEVQPLITERFQREWIYPDIDPFVISPSIPVVT
ncbi:MAG: metallophosphoesterase [Halothece sp.]